MNQDLCQDFLDGILNNDSVAPNKNLFFKCKEDTCDGNLIETNEGLYICEECGITNHTLIDHTGDYNGDNINGGIINPHFQKSSLGTSIDAKSYHPLKRVSVWGYRPYSEKSLCDIFTEIERICMIHNIKRAVIDNAQIIFKNISQVKHQSGKNQGKKIILRNQRRRGLIGACVYKGALLQKQPRSEEQVASMFDLTLQQLRQGIKMIDTFLTDNFSTDPQEEIPSFVQRFCHELALDTEKQSMAVKIARNICRLQITCGHQSTSVAATAIILMGERLGVTITKKQLQQVTFTSDITINKTFKLVHTYKNIVADDSHTDIYLQLLHKAQNERNI
uniref:Transcription factor TFIIB repeat n=1 Tax=Megaviridae environmental sample TaxID=1737588 RepID=A0A5J6VJA2_9VIRU|nr:MAG: transcription factor TFIIB repeat [Megaviridae environmental sample]